MTQKKAPKYTLKQHMARKIGIITQFGILPTLEQKQYIKNLRTEIAVDRYCQSLIKEHLFSL